MIPSIVVAAALRIITIRGVHVLQVTPAIASAISAYAPAFEPWRERDYDRRLLREYRFSRRAAPFAIIGDFNGDGIEDVAIDGHAGDTSAVIAVVSGAKGWRTIVIQRLPAEQERATYLLPIRAPKHFEPMIEEHALDLRHDAFELNVYEKNASQMYYWREGKFVGYVTAD